MKKRFILATISTFMLMIATALVAQAQANRSFVSGNAGTDTGICPKTAPCKTLSYAQSVTNAAGEIVITESDGVGQVTITKALTIEAAPGQYGFIKTQPGNAGITVSPGVGNKVVLRNMQFSGQGGANTIGVLQTDGDLVIESCGFAQLTTGLSVSGASSRTTVVNSIFSGNGTGILDTGAKVDLEGVKLTFNTTALSADGNGGADATPANGPTQLRMQSGFIHSNATAILMNNAGANFPSGQCNAANVFLRSPEVHIVGNTTYAAISGSTAHNNACSPGQVYVGFVSQQQ